MLWTFVESRTSLSIERSAAAYAAESHVCLDHADHFELTENLVHAISGIWPDGSQPHETDLHALVAHVLNRETGGHGVSPLHGEDYLGAVGHEIFKPRAILPSEDFRKLGLDLLNERPRNLHCPGGLP